VFTIIRGTPFCGATHVMANLARAEKKEVYSNSPLLYKHNEFDINDINKIRNAVIVLDYPVEVLTTSPEISDKKKELLIAVLQSNYLGNIIYTTVSSKFPIDSRFNLFCDYYISCDSISMGVIRFSLTSTKNGSTPEYYDMNIFAKKRTLAYMPFSKEKNEKTI